MLRKTKLAAFICLTLLSSSAFSWNNGFYAGAGLGPEGQDFKQDATIVRPGDFNARDKTHHSGMGIFGTIFAGYGWTCNCFYLGGEGNLNGSTAAFDASNDEFLHRNFTTTTYKVPYSASLSILPGYLIDHSTVVYGRLGYAYGNFEISTQDNSLKNLSRNEWGIRYGLGLMHAIGCNLSLRMEYSQINYESTSFTAFDRPNNVTKSTKIYPTTGQVEFGIMYQF